MKNGRVSLADPIRVVRFAAVLWIFYVAALAVISQSLGDPRRGSTEAAYCIMLAAIALVCLGLSNWTWLQGRLGRSFMPLMVGIIVALPIAAAWSMIRIFPRSPVLDSQDLVLRLLPFLLVGFLLIAWQYRWQYMLLIVLAIAALNIGMIWSFPPPGATPDPGALPFRFFRGALTVPLIQTAVFLAVGFSISYLMSRLKNQQESLEAANIRLAHYTSTLEELATARERSRLARELHDTLAHTLSGLAVQLETMKAYWEVDQNMARSSLDRSISTARSGLEETRRALRALRASPLDDLGLAGALKAMVGDQTAGSRLTPLVSVTENLPALSPDVEQAVYRIAQEAVTNAVKHSKGKTLAVDLEFKDGKLELTVHDDGTGFDVEEAYKGSQFGLTAIRERAQTIGADLTVSSAPASGTEVRLGVLVGGQG